MMTNVAISSPFITLGQLLKEVGVIDSGGAAKFYLRDHPVWVNGEADDRRGRKLYPNDTVKLADGQTVTITEAP